MLILVICQCDNRKLCKCHFQLNEQYDFSYTVYLGTVNLLVASSANADFVY